jgi:hypothetical protein
MLRRSRALPRRQLPTQHYGLTLRVDGPAQSAPQHLAPTVGDGVVGLAVFQAWAEACTRRRTLILPAREAHGTVPRRMLGARVKAGLLH